MRRRGEDEAKIATALEPGASRGRGLRGRLDGVEALREADRYANPGQAAPLAAVRTGRRRGCGRLVQVFADEPVEIAVEHPLGVTDLVVGAVILDPLVGMQEVASDLRSPLRRLDLPALLRQLLGP